MGFLKGYKYKWFLTTAVVLPETTWVPKRIKAQVSQNQAK